MRNGESSDSSDSDDSDDSYEDRKRKKKKKHKKHGSSDSSDDNCKKSKSKKPSSFGKRGNPSSGKRWLTFLLLLEQRTQTALLFTLHFSNIMHHLFIYLFFKWPQNMLNAPCFIH